MNDSKLTWATATFAVALVLAFGLAACGRTAAPPVQPATDQVATLGIQDLVVGTGAEATPGSRVTVHYTGWLYDKSKPEAKGTEFDSSRTGWAAVFVPAWRGRCHRGLGPGRCRHARRRPASPHDPGGAGLWRKRCRWRDTPGRHLAVRCGTDRCHTGAVSATRVSLHGGIQRVRSGQASLGQDVL